MNDHSFYNLDNQRFFGNKVKVKGVFPSKMMVA